MKITVRRVGGWRSRASSNERMGHYTITIDNCCCNLSRSTCCIKLNGDPVRRTESDVCPERSWRQCLSADVTYLVRRSAPSSRRTDGSMGLAADAVGQGKRVCVVVCRTGQSLIDIFIYGLSIVLIALIVCRALQTYIYLYMSCHSS